MKTIVNAECDVLYTTKKGFATDLHLTVAAI